MEYINQKISHQREQGKIKNSVYLFVYLKSVVFHFNITPRKRTILILKVELHKKDD